MPVSPTGDVQTRKLRWRQIVKRTVRTLLVIMLRTAYLGSCGTALAKACRIISRGSFQFRVYFPPDLLEPFTFADRVAN
jgi:hypothetical protein